MKHDKELERRTLKFARGLIELSNHSDVENIMVWIQLNKKIDVVSFVRGEFNWPEIALPLLSREDIIAADNGIIRAKGNDNLFSKIIDRVLFEHFCETIVDLRHEAQEYVDKINEHDCLENLIPIEAKRCSYDSSDSQQNQCNKCGAVI